MKVGFKIVGRVDALPSGRFRFRTEIGGKTRSETCDTLAEAEGLQRELSRELALRGPRPRHRITLADFSVRWFASRRVDAEVRDVEGEQGRWDHHVAATDLGRSALVDLTPALVNTWFREQCSRRIQYPYGHPRNGAPVSRSTIKKALVIVRLCLDEAVLEGLIPSNPARAFRLRRRHEARTHEPWTYLELHEQGALLAGAPTELHDMITYALCLGPREGEQWNQKLCDVRPDGVVIRYGSRGRATKGGKVRTVPYLGQARAAVERQLVRLEGRANPEGLLWPTPRGRRRQRGKLPKGWREALVAAGIVPERRHDQRPVRWQDLRHSCASSLVAGWWGPAWTLQQVRDLLGHSSVTVTERYAHLAPSALRAAAKATTGGPGSSGTAGGSTSPAPPRRRHDAKSPAESADRDALLTRRSRVRVPFDPLSDIAGLAPAESDGRDGVVADAARAYVLAAADASPASRALAIDLAEEVLATDGVALALDILDGDPCWAAKALRLARLVLDLGDNEEQAEVTS